MKYIIDVPDEHTDIKVFYTDADMKIIQSMRYEPYIEPEKNVKNNYTCLCDTCKFNVPDCKATAEDVLYGDGLGNDNVCCCNEYQANTVDRKQIEDEVWEFVRIMFQVMDTVDRLECFGNKGMPSLSGHSVLSDMTYQEAKAKYEAWKKEKDEIRVGDEVEAEPGNKSCVLYENPDGTQVFVFKADGTAAWWSKCAIHKTIRHFDEVEELLKKMKE